MLQRMNCMNEYLQIMINAMFNGMGIALGVYLSNRTIIESLKKMEERLKKNKKRRLENE